MKIEINNLYFIANTNCTNDGLALLDPMMPSFLFIEDRTFLNATQRAQVFCKGQKLLGGPVNSTYENGVLYLECNSTTKTWSPSETVWPTDANCISSNKNCSFANFPATPGILIG